MAIAFGRSAPFSGTGASPLAAALTLNAGETGIVLATLNPTTLAVTGVSDNAAGGSSTYSSPPGGALNQGTSIRGECWRTGAGTGKASTSTSMAFSGTNTDSGLIAAAYTGVLAIGNFSITSGTGANPSITLATQDANNWVVFGFALLNGGAITAGTGNLRQTDADLSIQDALVDNTSVGAGNVTGSITLAAGPWVGWALELRTVAGGVAVGSYGTRMTPGQRGPFDQRGFLKAAQWDYTVIAQAASTSFRRTLNPFGTSKGKRTKGK